MKFGFDIFASNPIITIFANTPSDSSNIKIKIALM